MHFDCCHCLFNCMVFQFDNVFMIPDLPESSSLFVTSFFHFYIESQNHRITCVGRDLKDHLIPTTITTGRDTTQLLRAPSNLDLNTSKDRPLKDGQHVPVSHHSQGKNSCQTFNLHLSS